MVARNIEDSMAALDVLSALDFVDHKKMHDRPISWGSNTILAWHWMSGYGSGINCGMSVISRRKNPDGH